MPPVRILVRAAVRLADLYATRAAQSAAAALRERLARYDQLLAQTGQVLLAHGPTATAGGRPRSSVTYTSWSVR